MPEYSENPTTSILVFITTIGFETIDYTDRAKALETNWLGYSFLKPISLSDVSE